MTRIAAIERGEMPFYEPGLDVLVAKNVHEERLSFTTDLAEGMSKADVVFIAVQTPQSEDSGEADLSYVWEVGKQIGERLEFFGLFTLLRKDAFIIVFSVLVLVAVASVVIAVRRSRARVRAIVVGGAGAGTP